MIIRGPDARRVITTTKTLIKGAVMNRSFRKSAIPPSSAIDTHDAGHFHMNRRALILTKKHVFASKYSPDRQRDKHSRGQNVFGDNCLHLFVSPSVTWRRRAKTEHNKLVHTAGNPFLAVMYLQSPPWLHVVL